LKQDSENKVIVGLPVFIVFSKEKLNKNGNENKPMR